MLINDWLYFPNKEQISFDRFSELNFRRNTNLTNSDDLGLQRLGINDGLELFHVANTFQILRQWRQNFCRLHFRAFVAQLLHVCRRNSQA